MLHNNHPIKDTLEYYSGKSQTKMEHKYIDKYKDNQEKKVLQLQVRCQVPRQLG